jgi:hypothetical protein
VSLLAVALAAGSGCGATPDPGVIVVAAASSGPAGFGPADLASAYALDRTRQPDHPLVAIINFAHYADAESDLAAYRSQYGLPPCTVAGGCLTIVNQTGAASPLPAPPDAGDTYWNPAAAGGLQMVSAVCPRCTLLLVEGADSGGMLAAQAVAARLGAAVIVDSWVVQKTAGQTLETHFTLDRPVSIFSALWAGGGKVAFDPDQYPATSAQVIAVGSTKLVRSPGSARGWSESASTYSQSSCSKSVPIPDFQSGIATGCTFRGTPDISIAGDFDSPVALHVHGQWTTGGGATTVAALAAGIYALYDLGAATPRFAYAHPDAWFDITTGRGGACDSAACAAGRGWDPATGFGSPNGARLNQLSPRPMDPPDLAEPPAPADLSPAPPPAADAGIDAAPNPRSDDAAIGDAHGGCTLAGRAPAPGGPACALVLALAALFARCGFPSRRLRRTSNP